jgi:hypothetical protein
MSSEDLNYKGYTNIKSALTKELFQKFRDAFFHFNQKIQEHSKMHHSFYTWIHDLFQYICDGRGTRAHINNEDIEKLHERVEIMVEVLKTTDLDDKDKVMLDVIVKTGNYLAIIRDFIAQDARLREQDARLRILESKKRKSAAGWLQHDGQETNLDDSLRSLCLLAQDAYITP